MKNLKKLALILRAMDVTANVLKESVTYSNGDRYEYTYLEVRHGGCVWNIWNENGWLFEVNLYINKDCVYCPLYYSSLFGVVQRISLDYAKYGK
nr:MAG TPA: hypothetical protein [Caudoviricetes sp.]